MIYRNVHQALQTAAISRAMSSYARWWEKEVDVGDDVDDDSDEEKEKMRAVEGGKCEEAEEL